MEYQDSLSTGSSSSTSLVATIVAGDLDWTTCNGGAPHCSPTTHLLAMWLTRLVCWCLLGVWKATSH